MKILVKTIAGSHLFGTNTPTSDHDFKGVYLPSLQDCITGNVTHSVHDSTNNTVGTRNTQEDVDTEFYSAQKFFKMLEEAFDGCATCDYGSSYEITFYIDLR